MKSTPLLIIGLAIFGAIAGVSWFVERCERRDFLDDCTKAKPYFECVALWRRDESGVRFEYKSTSEGRP